MSEEDQIHTIYVIAIIIFLASWVNAGIFNYTMGGAPNFSYLSEGEFYVSGLFQTTAIMMFLYVCYKRFLEGWKERRVKDQG